MEAKILVVDDHTIVRHGLIRLLESEPHLRVVGEAGDGREAVRLVERLTPDIVIMDIAMPLLNGVEAARQMKKIHPPCKIIILSMHAHDRYIKELLLLGASAYLLKDCSGGEVIQAVSAVLKGDTYLSPCISRKVVEDYVTLNKKTAQDDLYNQLSDREREIFQLLAEGKSASAISNLLNISLSTVKTHRANIMEKLQIENLQQLIYFALSLGIVEAPPLPPDPSGTHE